MPFLFGHRRKHPPQTVTVLRGGQPQVADEAWHASQSGDLNRMLRALDKPTNPIDRHFLLLNIVEVTYRQRNDPRMRDLCKRVAKMHVDEFPRIAGPLQREMGVMPRVPTFVWLATLLTEDGEYDAAIKVYQLAQRYGLRDGTKGGFEDRINRIQKAKQRAQQER